MRLSFVPVTLTTPAGTHVTSTSTDQDGSYTLRALPGDYLVRFGTDDPLPATPSGADWQPEWYDDAASRNDAQRLTLTGSDINGIDAELAAKPRIEGQVTDADSGAPVPFAQIRLFQADDPFSLRSATTDPDGNYSIAAPDGDWYVQFSTSGFMSAQSHRTEWYDDQAQRDNADPVTVAGSDVTGIDAALTPNAAITGTLTEANGDPAAWAPVYLKDRDGNFVNYASADSSGRYRISADPGTYTVRFAEDYYPSGPMQATPGTWRGEWYDDAASLSGAQRLTLADDDLTADAQLERNPTISGTVTEEGGALSHVAYLGIEKPNGEVVMVIGTSGTYTVPVAPGRYIVRFGGGYWDSYYRTEYYDDVVNRDNATVLDVGDANVTGIDASLNRMPQPTSTPLPTSTPAPNGFSDVQVSSSTSLDAYRWSW